eukprot:GABV01000742.1.p1 GENE.GABV01000742.1~~GABV01000742.1.p1  ORF type:complete len:356 (-),score=134.66 GABV01000742.1:32-1099(-)
MGGACSSGLTEEEKARVRWEKSRAKQIETNNEKARMSDNTVKKLLLLGAGESGKSTLFKQMITLYGKGYTKEELMGFKGVVYNNTLSAMKTLVEKMEDFEIDPPDGYQVEDFLLENDSMNDLADEIKDVPMDSPIDPNLANAVAALWSDVGIQNTFNLRSHYQLPDSSQYFFERVQELAKPDYCPTKQDVLRCRVRTTGIVETTFEIEGNVFKMFDVGGQRNERKKWIHCFENVTSVIFVAAISEYDQMLYEDESVNRMEEALDLFAEICNSRWFRDTSIILFLNKRDLFENKITKVPLTACPSFSDYMGAPGSYDEGVQYIQSRFESLNQTAAKEVYSHVTCATDSNNVDHVFN